MEILTLGVELGLLVLYLGIVMRFHPQIQAFVQTWWGGLIGASVHMVVCFGIIVVMFMVHEASGEPKGQVAQFTDDTLTACVVCERPHIERGSRAHGFLAWQIQRQNQGQ